MGASTVRLGIVGCGAVTERLHLPAALSSRAVQVTALVDTAPGRAAALASHYNVPHAFTEIAALSGKVDAAVLALPNSLHLDAARALAKAGVHVMVEKPMARTVAECEAMQRDTESAGVVLSVAHVRRFFPWARLVKDLLAAELLGTLRSIDVQEGAPYRWPVLSSLPFDRVAAGGGVLIDVGPHVFDLLRWWKGEWELVTYEDDALGGVEADCITRLRTRDGCEARVELSRTRDLRNTMLFKGDRATLEVGLGFEGTVELRIDGTPVSLHGSARPHAAPPRLIPDAWSMVAAFVEQLDHFAAATRGADGMVVSGADGTAAVAMVEACYASRTGTIDPFPLAT